MKRDHMMHLVWQFNITLVWTNGATGKIVSPTLPSLKIFLKIETEK